MSLLHLHCTALPYGPPPCGALRNAAAAAAGRSMMPAALHQPFLVSRIPKGSGQQWRRRSGAPVTALRGVESFEADFELTEQQSSTLNELLYSDMFCQQASACLLLVNGLRLRMLLYTLRNPHHGPTLPYPATHRCGRCNPTRPVPQVVRECGLPEGAGLQFTGVLFQPRPWTPSETKGMPAEVEERYYGRPEQYTIINGGLGPPLQPPMSSFYVRLVLPV